MTVFHILTLSLVLCSLNQASSDVYYITTNSTDACTGSCLTVSQFAANSGHYLHSNTTLVFLPGTHYLDTVNLTLSNVDNFVMKSKNSTAQIKCKNFSHIDFSHSQYIHITDLEFIGCEGNQVKHVQEFFVQDTKIKGQENNETALELVETTAHIFNSTFVSNTKGSYREIQCVDIYCSGRFTGGAIIATNSTVNISQSKFENNRAEFGGAIFAEQHSIINMSGNVFLNNTAIQDGGVLYSYNSTVTIEASEFHDNSATRYGGVLQLFSSNSTIEASRFHGNNAFYGGVLASLRGTITIEASGFHDNSATRYGGVLQFFSSNSTIEASRFHGNNAFYGGVLESIRGTITIEASEFHDNSAAHDGGVLFYYSSTLAIEASEFYDNSASDGGVLTSISSNSTIEASRFHGNNALHGGVLESITGTTTIEASEFHNNNATNGGVMDSQSSTIIIKSSEFDDNRATYEGGVGLNFFGSNITIESSGFYRNSAMLGGVLFSINYNTITIESSEFHNNSATSWGGVLYSTSSTIKIGGSKFTKNNSPIGGVIYAIDNSKIQHHSYLLIDNNSANRYAVIYLSDSELRGNNSANVTFSRNLGSLVAFNSNITFNFMIHAIFVNNQAPQTTTVDFQEGGAITLFQSNVYFDGLCNLEHNLAENGGAIYSTESKLYVTGNITIAHNTATRNGGGVYLATSELNCQQKSTFVLSNNTAVHKGGGLHAISSSLKATSAYKYYAERIYTGTRMNFTKNAAKMGGALSLEGNAKLYVLKYHSIIEYVYQDTNTTIFTANKADYGGAVYVDDDTNSGTCASDRKTECFFQVLAIYMLQSELLKTQSIHFSQNYAIISGSTLYGGLLDRCAMSLFAEARNKHNDSGQIYEYKGNGVSYFKDISTGENTLISSRPVQVCLCIHNKHNCTHQSQIYVEKGQTFTVSLVAVDQIGQPVNAIIQTSLNFAESGLAEGQLARTIPAQCTDLTFNVVSPHDSESLTLYVSDGPCKDAELSRRTIDIHFLPCSCPIGLQVSWIITNCICQCHSDISQNLEYCDSHTGSIIKQPQSRAWISFIIDTNLTGYLVYPNCPFDYCLSTSPLIDLNQPNGADAQCAFNRSSLLCGSCQPGLSLSLGSSRCLPCPSYWPALFIAITVVAILAGIALVALLLVLNMTIAIGTLNGLIFYANIVHLNRSILLPFQDINFISVIISWLNLELGIDTCYFPGMNTYIKTWLQFVFPIYVILLVVLVIIISSYSTKFSNLIGKKNPVATLATLILLSYAKLLEICFRSLSVGILEYPDGSSELLWLPDATVKYLSGKHIPLFIAAVLILLVGLVYTALLFLWQCLLYLPKWRIFRWLRNPKIQTFVEIYHTPYTPKHQYWTGLLLIARTILHFVAAVNASNDPTVSLTSISFIVCCSFALNKFIGRRMYRKWPADVLETFFYLNILSFAIFTWYTLDNSDSNQEAAAYTSVITTFIVLLLIILYHVYTYTTVFSKIKKTKVGRIIDRLFTDTDPEPTPRSHRWSPPPDDDIHRFDELMDDLDCPVSADDYNIIPLVRPTPRVKPTFSLKEVHQPYLASPDPEEATNTQNIQCHGTAEEVQVEVIHERQN